MPDVLTHLLVGISIALLVRSDGPRYEQLMIVLGAILIDIERPFTWLLEGTPFYWIGISSAFHSILGAIILSYVGAACFDLETIIFKNRFKLILIGCASHLLLDMVMYPWAELGLYLLYPLKIAFSFHLLWPDFWLYPIFGLSSLLFALCLRFLIARIKATTSKHDLL